MGLRIEGPNFDVKPEDAWRDIVVTGDRCRVFACGPDFGMLDLIASIDWGGVLALASFEFGDDGRGDLERPTKPRRPQTRKITQCMQKWLSSHYLGVDWSAPTISSDAPLPYMGASTNSDLEIFVGHRQFGSFERNSWLFFHEMAHMPQWASGDLTTLSYVGSAARHFFKHDNIPVEL
jgi:hypothetical protein